MENVRIELIPRVQFVRTFYRAALDYSRFPWVQIASFFGSLESPQKGKIPVLISRSKNEIRVFVHLGKRWRTLDEKKVMRWLDPDAVLHGARTAMGMNLEEIAHETNSRG